MRGPKRPMVLRLKSFSIGVPVKPTITALGSALDMRPPRMPYCVRWASSTMTMTFSDAFSMSSTPVGVVNASSNFWMVVITVRLPPCLRTLCKSRGSRWPGLWSRRRARRSSGSGRDRSILSGAGKPQRSKVLAICWSNCLRSVTTTMVGLLKRGSRRSFVASHSIVSDLPDPCVCQTTPPRSSGLRPDMRRPSTARTARYCW